MVNEFPILLQHMDACGVRSGHNVRVSMIPAVSMLLVSRGANRLIVPTSGEWERERAETGVQALPKERRSLVKFIDSNASVNTRVQEYLEPLQRQADSWPENAFVGYAADFLYELLLATKYRSGVISDSISVLQDFVPIVNPARFSREARFRVAEIAYLVCAYQPAALESGLIAVESGQGLGPGVWDILETSEFQRIIAQSGRIGYLRHPILGLRRVRDQFTRLIANPKTKHALSLAVTAADVASVSTAGAVAGSIARILQSSAELPGGAHYWPPFLSLGPLKLHLYRAALHEGAPGTIPSAGTIMVFERQRSGVRSIHWLNEGEEKKLEQEAGSKLATRIKRHREANDALAGIGQPPVSG